MKHLQRSFRVSAFLIAYDLHTAVVNVILFKYGI